MTDDEKALIRTICETPDCDVPRLVYADWLEENGREELASYIRTSIAVNQTEPGYSFGYDGNFARMFGVDPSFWEASENHRAVRGFVSEIRCTLAEFMGEKCDHCDGATYTQTDTGGNFWQAPCSRCRGRGSTPSLARTLFGTHPITRVVLTDKEPSQYTNFAVTGDSWYWCEDRGQTGHLPDRLPQTIADKLTGHLNVDNGVYQFRSREGAMDALPLAAVNYARKLHGYTPLPAFLESVG